MTKLGIANSRVKCEERSAVVYISHVECSHSHVYTSNEITVNREIAATVNPFSTL